MYKQIQELFLLIGFIQTVGALFLPGLHVNLDTVTLTPRRAAALVTGTASMTSRPCAAANARGPKQVDRSALPLAVRTDPPVH